MKNFKELISCRLISKSLLSARPFSFLDEEPPDAELTTRGPTDTDNLLGTMPANTQSNDAQVIDAPLHQPVVAEVSHLAHHGGDDKNADPLTKVEALQIKLLRLVHRIGLSPDNLVVAQVLYRLHLASLIRDGESDAKRPSLKIDRARAIAAELEAAGQTELDFSFKILVLGKTGVGKSATINSLFGQTKAETDAFLPATDRIQEVVGTIGGVRVTFIDTPGLSPSSSNQHRNRKIMLSVKRFIRKSPPDIVLYFERLDVVNVRDNNYVLLKLITDVFGSSIWFNTILVMTHSSSPPPERSDGYPMSYESFAGHCSSLLRHHIDQAVSGTEIENPVLFVENHPLCGTNTKGEKVLPNGQVWMSQFLLLCTATKVLGDANSLLKFQDTIQLTQTSTRLPSLPHLLSSLLRPRSLMSAGGFDDEGDELSDNGEDDYDQLPPIRILTKAQFQRLSKAHRNAYLDELDYRETLYLKKQRKEERRRRRESVMMNNNASESNDDHESNASVDAAHMSDMALPSSFDSDIPVYRYRCLLGNDLWLVRPVLDSQGWDHDVGFDGVSLEVSQEVKKTLLASIVGQMSKEKEDFSIQSECAAEFMDPRGLSALAGIDVQSAGKDLVCTVRGDAKLRNLNCNHTGGGLSLTSFGKMYYIGAKLEDSVSIGRRCKLTLNGGRVVGCGQVAYGGSLEAALRGKDYPVRDDKATLAATFLSYDKEMVFGGSFQSDFRIGRSMKMSVNTSLNSRWLGQVSVRTGTSEHVGIALIAVVSLARALFRTRAADAVE